MTITEVRNAIANLYTSGAITGQEATQRHYRVDEINSQKSSKRIKQQMLALYGV